MQHYKMIGPEWERARELTEAKLQEEEGLMNKALRQFVVLLLEKRKTHENVAWAISQWIKDQYETAVTLKQEAWETCKSTDPIENLELFRVRHDQTRQAHYTVMATHNLLYQAGLGYYPQRRNAQR